MYYDHKHKRTKKIGCDCTLVDPGWDCGPVDPGCDDLPGCVIVIALWLTLIDPVCDCSLVDPGCDCALVDPD